MAGSSQSYSSLINFFCFGINLLCNFSSFKPARVFSNSNSFDSSTGILPPGPYTEAAEVLSKAPLVSAPVKPESFFISAAIPPDAPSSSPPLIGTAAWNAFLNAFTYFLSPNFFIRAVRCKPVASLSLRLHTANWPPAGPRPVASGASPRKAFTNILIKIFKWEFSCAALAFNCFRPFGESFGTPLEVQRGDSSTGVISTVNRWFSLSNSADINRPLPVDVSLAVTAPLAFPLTISFSAAARPAATLFVVATSACFLTSGVTLKAYAYFCFWVRKLSIPPALISPPIRTLVFLTFFEKLSNSIWLILPPLLKCFVLNNSLCRGTPILGKFCLKLALSSPCLL